ncbi:MAG: hypothetical protein H0U76_00585 [Ktedonobacteraceae bacterium]|nr:hypothetical protein [Ktedonobacteraceae bacterium]
MLNGSGSVRVVLGSRGCPSQQTTLPGCGGKEESQRLIRGWISQRVEVMDRPMQSIGVAIVTGTIASSP